MRTASPLCPFLKANPGRGSQPGEGRIIVHAKGRRSPLFCCALRWSQLGAQRLPLRGLFTT